MKIHSLFTHAILLSTSAIAAPALAQSAVSGDAKVAGDPSVPGSAAVAASAAVAQDVPVSAGATAPADTYIFKVAPGRLTDVVSDISKQAHASITYEAQGASKAKGSGVSGKMTLEQALDQALKGSGYMLRVNGTRGFTIVSSTASQNVQGEIVITAYRRDFARNSSSLLTRTDTPLHDTPATIDSVTQEVMQSQNATTINEALRFLPGVISYQNGSSSTVAINQEITSSTYTNGLRNSPLSENQPTIDVEAIEVLKGPAAILTGSEFEGGVLNFVPKHADGRSGGYVKAGAGTGNEYLGEFDAAGAISRDAGLFWRVTGQLDHADHLPSGISTHPYSAAIDTMIGYRADGLVLDLGFEHFAKRSPTSPSASLNLTTGKFTDWGDILDPRHTYLFVVDNKASYNLEKRLVSSDSFELKFRARGLYDWGHTTGTFIQVPRADFVVPGRGTFNVFVQFSFRDSDKQASQYADLYAKFSTGPIAHQFIAGFDGSWANGESRTDIGVLPLPLNTPATALPLPPLSQSPERFAVDQYGVIAQDQMTWGRFHGLVGLRESLYRERDTSGFDGSVTHINKNKLSINGGLLFDASKAIALYVAYSNAFQPPNPFTPTFSGIPLAPPTRIQFEGGAKMDLLNKRLTLNLSAYKYTQSNTPGEDLDHPGFVTVIGDTKGHGYEGSLAGSITPTLKVLAGYTHSVSRTLTGIDLALAPSDVANLLAIKTFRVADKQSIDLGVGGNYVSGFWAPDVSAPIRQTYISRASVQANLSLAYHASRYTITAVVNNLFDRRNYQPGGRTKLPIDVPRSFRITAAARF